MRMRMNLGRGQGVACMRHRWRGPQGTPSWDRGRLGAWAGGCGGLNSGPEEVPRTLTIPQPPAQCLLAFKGMLLMFS